MNKQRMAAVKTVLMLCLGLCGLLEGAVTLAQEDNEPVRHPEHRAAGTAPAEMAPKAAQSLLVDVARAGNRLVAVGSRGHILYSDDGARWTQAKVPVDVLLTAVSFVDARHGWAVGHDQVILHTMDGGVSWTLQGFQRGSPPLLDVLFLNAQRGFAVGSYGQFLQTQNGGAHWSAVQTPLVEEGLHFNALARLADGSLFLVGEQGMMARSEDGGETWQRLQSPYESSLFAVAPKGQKGAVVGGLRGNAYMTDDVATGRWTKIETGSVQSIFGIARLTDGSFLLAGLNASLLRLNPDGVVRKVELDRAAAGIETSPPQGPPFVQVKSEIGDQEVGAFSDVTVMNGTVITVGDAGIRRWKSVW